MVIFGKNKSKVDTDVETGVIGSNQSRQTPQPEIEQATIELSQEQVMVLNYNAIYQQRHLETITLLRSIDTTLKELLKKV